MGILSKTKTEAPSYAEQLSSINCVDMALNNL